MDVQMDPRQIELERIGARIELLEEKDQLFGDLSDHELDLLARLYRAETQLIDELATWEEAP